MVMTDYLVLSSAFLLKPSQLTLFLFSISALSRRPHGIVTVRALDCPPSYFRSLLSELPAIK